ncbi:MAG: cupin domain-containing protein [Planctomycetes bacterium]|nr:cupin domain-containing protein [Planctomycetota bacterium]
MSGYRMVTEATRIPVPGGKLIEELFGRVNTGTDTFSLAHMVAPAGWSEPAQTPEFGELTIMLRGRMRLEIGDESLELAAGQCVWADPGQQVRYSNPFDEENEYYAICIPAFSPDTAHRA